RALRVVVEAVSRVVQHAQAEVIGHASEAQFTQRGGVFAPSSLDSDAVREAVAGRVGGQLGRVVNAELVVARAGLHFHAVTIRDAETIAVGRRPHHQVVE